MGGGAYRVKKNFHLQKKQSDTNSCKLANDNSKPAGCNFYVLSVLDRSFLFTSLSLSMLHLLRVMEWEIPFPGKSMLAR